MASWTSAQSFGYWDEGDGLDTPQTNMTTRVTADDHLWQTTILCRQGLIFPFANFPTKKILEL